MKVLLLNSYYTPEVTSSGYISENRIEKFAESGIEMEMLVPTPTRNVDIETVKKYKRIKKELQYDGMLRVTRFPMIPESRNSVLKGLRYILVNLNHFVRSLSYKDINCIFCTSTPPTTGFVAALLKRIKKVKFVYNLQDIFPDSLVATGLAKKGSLIWKIGHLMESFIYKHADVIVVISEDFKCNLLAKGVPIEKIKVIYNWVDQSVIKPIAKKDNPLYEEFGIQRDVFTVVYAGNMGLAQNIRVIIDVAKHLTDFNIQFLLFGKGAMKEKMENEAKKLNLKNVYFLPFQPYDKVAHVYSLGDVGIVSCKKGLGGSAMPSKTWSIMASGTAVIASFDEGELKNIIESHECGTFSMADDAESLKESILKYYNNKDLCVKHGTNGVKVVSEKFSREKGTTEYLETIKSII